MKNKIISASIIITILLAGILIGISTLSRPKVISLNESENEFSAERAFTHITALSRESHPTGSEQIVTVRNYILQELNALGLSPEIQVTNVTKQWKRSAITTTVENIIAVIPGTNSEKAILMDAHYDTRAMTPGAADNSMSIAVLLETARAVLAGPKLQNDIILLFPDNEEYGGALGSKEFVDSHPLAQKVGMVLNFEGLGSAGPSILFESGPDSRYLIKRWAEVSDLPVGQSWFNEIYQMTPINTDLNSFNEKQIPGLNFANWANGTVYHSAMDIPENLELKSVQHNGSYALSMVKCFGNEDLRKLNEVKGDAVYFNLFRGVLVNYPANWSLPIVIITGLILFAVIVLGVKKRLLRTKGILIGCLASLFIVVMSSALVTGLWMLINNLQSEYQAMFTFRGMIYNAHIYLIAFTALTLAVSAAIVIFIKRKNSVYDLTLGAICLWWMISLVLSIIFPPFSYLFSWPLLFCSIAIGSIVLLKKTENLQLEYLLIYSIGLLPALILMIPAIYVMFHFALSPMIAVVIFFIAMLFCLMIPYFDVLTFSKKWIFPICSLLVFGLFLIIGTLSARFSETSPRPNGVGYMVNNDTAEAHWFIAGTQLDEWTGQFVSQNEDVKNGTIGELYPAPIQNYFPVIKTKAPYVALQAPELEVHSDFTDNNVRTMELRIRSARKAALIRLDIISESSVNSIFLNGEMLEIQNLIYYSVPEEGFGITLKLNPTGSVDLQLSDRTWDLPSDLLRDESIDIKPRPVNMMRMPNFDYGSLALKTIKLQ